MILIAVPTYERIFPQTFEGIWNMAHGRGDVDFKAIYGYSADHARNKIAKEALEGGYSHVLMLDSDTVPPPDALDLLMEHGADLALGFYRANRRSGANVTAIFKPWKSYSRRYEPSELDEAVEKGVKSLPIKGGALGCALIDTSLFRKLQYPYFKWLEYPNGEHLGEDLYFCNTASKVQARMVADPRVRCDHIIQRRESL